MGKITKIIKIIYKALRLHHYERWERIYTNNNREDIPIMDNDTIQTIGNTLAIKTIMQVLVEKGICTEDEFKNKYNELREQFIKREQKERE